ncbi:TspO/MBR family protein [Halobacterium jilantaiense]|uniref:TspO and MBR related proteins n=1 Tax=Halobacterium jilantaiense TaxID=355548 RepID=A0A1I0PU09_9EURY|nr:TspO/MBR family protein [Halobacterium jilantaiense]SEW17915.1 TspO and MBR related proteins [Halobacterium jilantaiense]
MDLSRDDLPGLALAVLVCEAVGASPALVTATGSGTWYDSLAQPAFAPPNWVFGPVWTALFAALGVAAYLVLRDGEGRQRTVAFGLFVAQYVLNVAWTLVFFGDQNITGGLAVITGLWLLIVATLAAFVRVRRAAGYLLVPYLAWVSFAAVLNYGFWTLN